MTITYRPKVFEDLLDLAYYIAQDNLAAADAFLDACDQTFTQLAQFPGLGKSRAFADARLQGVRMWFIKGYAKHLVFYRPLADGIEIIRVLHSARDLDNLFAEEEF